MNDWRDRIRTKQDKLIALAEQFHSPEDLPISSMQHGAPTIAQLRQCLYAEFEPSIDSAIAHLLGR